MHFIGKEIRNNLINNGLPLVQQKLKELKAKRMVLVTSMILEFLFYYNTRCCDTSQVHDDYTNMYIIYALYLGNTCTLAFG